MGITLISHGFQHHYVIGFANGLASNGVEVKLIRSADLPFQQLKPEVVSCDFKQNLGGELGFARKGFGFLFYHLRLFALGMVACRQIVHVIGLLRWPLLTGIFEGLWFRLFSKQYWLTVHNLLPHDRHTWWNRLVFKASYRIPHKLIVHTDKMKSELVGKFGISSAKITVVEHGINDALPELSESQESARNRLGLQNHSENPYVVLFFGRVHPYKGLERLIDVFADLPSNCILLIAGNPSTPDYKLRIEQTISECVAKDRIHSNLSWVEDSQIPTYFAASNLVVMPYRHIDQSGVIFASFRYGLPILATDVGALKEYVGPAGLVVPPNDRESLKKALIRFASGSINITREKVIARGKQFEWKSTLANLAEEIQSSHDK